MHKIPANAESWERIELHWVYCTQPFPTSQEAHFAILKIIKLKYTRNSKEKKNHICSDNEMQSFTSAYKVLNGKR